MEGSVDDPSAPDSWEMADLDASMSRLLLSTKKSSASSSPPPDSVEEEEVAVAAPPLASFDSSDQVGGVPVDSASQVDQFLREALEKPRERLAILRMEQDVEKFIRDPTQHQLEFQELPNSYLRLAAHRVAQHYYLQSIAIPDNSMPDGSGSGILLCKSSMNCRLPPVRLADIPVNLPQEDNGGLLKVAIKQRPKQHSQNIRNANSQSSRTNYQKSVEERKEEYNRARARIFNSNESMSTVSGQEDKIKLPDIIKDTFLSARPDKKSVIEGSGNYHGRTSSDSASSSSRVSRIKIERDPVASRPKVNNKVAIFRDRDVDSKDPDYDRSYDRCMQRFDPGFGFNGPYAIQPLYSPTVTYNTEFPQLGSGHLVQTPLDHQRGPIPSHLLGPRLSPPVPKFGPPESMMPPYSSNPARAHSTAPLYINSSQYSVPTHPGMSFPHRNGPIQTFTQAHLQQPDSRFGLARPR
ncbi:R3H domain-containing protein 2-like [Zingiber officinale]|uniref:Uncharacterized protein n=1 Tax=Zingiber officinale TaxID=94328 RepID=A0A8J5BT83_ZINOF|nr:R3H domain-containing protein 2-like [Zingiber officinale]XP_042451313.1 R3H domain-containing protein 2-like [Zingiber officinale]KAG6466343.1 hypothetical protein ZIOFF_075834 [Zingiber officinale]